MRQKGQDDWEDESSKGWHILGEVVCGEERWAQEFLIESRVL